MEKKEIIKYSSINLKNNESIIIYDDEIIYTRSDSNITNNIKDVSSKESIIKIKDKFFVEAMILGNAYMPLKQNMIEVNNKVKNMDVSELHRSKNTARKNITIRDGEFSIDIDMYIEEYGDIFEKFISSVKKMIIMEISK